MIVASGMVAPSAAQQERPASVRRLSAFCKLWGFVKFHHPALGDRTDLDWDAAAVEAIGTIRGDASPEDFRAAISGLLGKLDDPGTRLVADAEAAGESNVPLEGSLRFRVTADGILLVTLGDVYALSSAESQSTLKEIVERLSSVRAVVLDERSRSPVDAYGRIQAADALGQIQSHVTTTPLGAPGERRRVYYGYETTGPFSSGQDQSGFFTRTGPSLVPAATARNLPVVVVLNRYAAPPPATFALQANGKALLVFEGPPGDAAIGRFEDIDLGEGLQAQVRISESVHPDGTLAELQPDAVVDDGAVDAALALARAFHPSNLVRSRLPATAAPLTERADAKMECPAVELRLLALFRFWNVIRFFYPYRALLDEPWDTTLEELIPRFEEASSAEDYSRAVAALAAKLHDSHAYVAGAVYTQRLIGAGYPPIRVRIIEGQPVVTAITDAKAADSGVHVGDVVVQVDGEPAQSRLARSAALISASTPANLLDKAALVFMNGPVGIDVHLTVGGAGGPERTIDLPRHAEDYTTLYHRERSGDVVRRLPGKLGYVDLDRLAFSDVDSMFDRLRDTKAIISTCAAIRTGQCG